MSHTYAKTLTTEAGDKLSVLYETENVDVLIEQGDKLYSVSLTKLDLIRMNQMFSTHSNKIKIKAAA